MNKMKLSFEVDARSINQFTSFLVQNSENLGDSFGIFGDLFKSCSISFNIKKNEDHPYRPQLNSLGSFGHSSLLSSDSMFSSHSARNSTHQLEEMAMDGEKLDLLSMDFNGEELEWESDLSSCSSDGQFESLSPRMTEEDSGVGLKSLDPAKDVRLDKSQRGNKKYQLSPVGSVIAPPKNPGNTVGSNLSSSQSKENKTGSSVASSVGNVDSNSNSKISSGQKKSTEKARKTKEKKKVEEKTEIAQSTPKESALPTIEENYTIPHTDPKDHNNESIIKMIFTPTMYDLNKDYHASGWLVSCSKKLLNLWQCFEDNLLLAHSVGIEERIFSMDFAYSSKYLVASAVNPNTNQPYVALYSLESNSFLVLKNKISTNLESTQQICSLESLGGPLKYSIAVGIKKQINIYDLNASTVNPKASFEGHRENISSFKPNVHHISLFSGSNDGSIHFWDLKMKPSVPSLKFLKHNRQVNGLEVIDNNLFVSCSIDSTVLLWDIRRNNNPVDSWNVEGKSASGMRLNPQDKSTLAISTLKGVHLLKPKDSKKKAVVLLTDPQQRVVCPDIIWDGKRAQALYTAGVNGSVSIYNSNAVNRAFTLG